jgi:hypothetical protein
MKTPQRRRAQESPHFARSILFTSDQEKALPNEQPLKVKDMVHLTRGVPYFLIKLTQYCKKLQNIFTKRKKCAKINVPNKTKQLFQDKRPVFYRGFCYLFHFASQMKTGKNACSTDLHMVFIRWLVLFGDNWSLHFSVRRLRLAHFFIYYVRR